METLAWPLRLRVVALLSLSLFACGTAAPPEPGERAREMESARPATGGEGEPANSGRPGTLKLASWNLAWLNRKNRTGPVRRSDDDYERLRRYVARLGADVIALQEVDGPEAAARVFDPDEYAFHFSAQTDAQRTGFAYRKSLVARPNPDYAALDVGQVRVGADLSLLLGTGELRLMSVHLKSGCHQEALTSSKKECRKFAMQVPSLEAWVDARAAANEAAVVLGDFNRRFFRAGPADEVWQAIDDSEPPASDLTAPTQGRSSRCWDGAYPDFVDHIVLNLPASALLVPSSFEELTYEAADAATKSTLSDHCPIAVLLRVDAAGDAGAQNPVAKQQP